jgi:hypothetical protein
LHAVQDFHDERVAPLLVSVTVEPPEPLHAVQVCAA